MNNNYKSNTSYDYNNHCTIEFNNNAIKFKTIIYKNYKIFLLKYIHINNKKIICSKRLINLSSKLTKKYIFLKYINNMKLKFYFSDDRDIDNIISCMLTKMFLEL